MLLPKEDADNVEKEAMSIQRDYEEGRFPDKKYEMNEAWMEPAHRVPHLVDEKAIVNAFMTAIDKAHDWSTGFCPLVGHEEVRKDIYNCVQIIKLQSFGPIFLSIYELSRHIDEWIQNSEYVQKWIAMGQVRAIALKHAACNQLIFELEIREGEKAMLMEKIEEHVEAMARGEADEEMDDLDDDEEFDALLNKFREPPSKSGLYNAT